MTQNVFDGVAERLIGLGCVTFAAVEAVSPTLLALDPTGAVAIGMFGFLTSTGRSEAAVRATITALKSVAKAFANG